MSTPVIIGFIAVILVLAIFSLKTGKKSKKEQQAQAKNMYRKAYTILSRNFITQSVIHKIYSKLANLCIYKRDELYCLATQYFLISWGVSIAIIIIGIVAFSDFVAILICVCLALVVNTTLIEKRLDGQYLKVLTAMSKALGVIRQEYMRTNSVVDALNDAVIDDILKKPFDEIYSILTTTNAELRLQEFYSATPFRVLQTLVGICFNINNQGDTTNATGNSNFVAALTTLSTDINAEITKILTQKKKFGIIEYLPFVPVPAIMLIESYFSGIMPGTSLIYGGMIGYISRTVILLSVIACYSIVSRINSTVPVKEDDRVMWVRNLLDKPSIANFINVIKVKNRKAYKLNEKLKFALSRQTIEQLYVQKAVYGLIAFVMTLVVCASVVQMGGEFIRNSTQQLSLVATDEMAKYSKQTILSLDNRYFEQRMSLQPELTLTDEIKAVIDSVVSLVAPKETKSYTQKKEKYPDLKEDAIKEMVKSYMPGLSDLQVIDQVKRLQDKFNSVMGAKFHWWFIWIAFVCGLMGWKAPNILLTLRIMLVRTDAEDDFLQLQTLVSIFMTTNMDTLDTLYELSQQSRIHKEMLTYCYHSYPANPELELARMQSKTPLTEFKRFIGKLRLTISDLSLNEAFSDLIIEREQIMRIRELTIEATISRKRGLCGPLAMAPLAFMVVGELLIPLGYLGIMEFTKALSMM